MKKIMEVVLCLVLTFALVSCSKQEEKMKYDLIPMVMVDGELYLDTGHTGTYISNDDTYDREIISTVDGSEKPSEDNQSNFGAGFKYRYGTMEGTIEILMNNKCCIYATEEVRQKIQFPESDTGAKDEVQPCGTPVEEAFDIISNESINNALASLIECFVLGSVAFSSDSVNLLNTLFQISSAFSPATLRLCNCLAAVGIVVIPACTNVFIKLVVSNLLLPLLSVVNAPLNNISPNEE